MKDKTLEEVILESQNTIDYSDPNRPRNQDVIAQAIRQWIKDKLPKESIFTQRLCDDLISQGMSNGFCGVFEKIRNQTLKDVRQVIGEG